MKSLFALLAFTTVCALGQQTHGPGSYVRDENPELTDVQPMIQMALLLDTSSSMDGLVRQAQSQLWGIVNEFASATRDGEDPVFQIAVYEFGRNTLPSETGHVRKVIGLTSDLDAVYEGLFALEATKKSGSNEYCGWVIEQAARELGWSPSPKNLKAIYIAGNETFELGPIKVADACKTAIEAGVTVNTIFCGARSQGLSLGWDKGALFADGTFFAIDQNRVVVSDETPHDDEIRSLNERFNNTYLPFGAEGRVQKLRQVEQDNAADSFSASAFVDRAFVKGSKFYNAKEWDLVDAVRAGQVDLAELETQALPAALQNKTVEERQATIENLGAEREAIRGKLADLESARKEFLARRVTSSLPAIAEASARGVTLNEAVNESLKKQALGLGYKLK